MIVGLRFYNDGPSVEMIAETDAEKALLGIVAENSNRRWKCSPGYDYRPSRVERVVLEIEEKKANG